MGVCLRHLCLSSNPLYSRVVVWDYDSTFSARGSVQVGDNPAVMGYRVNRSSNQMARLMRLHTGAPPVGKPEWQLPFTNVSPLPKPARSE